MWRSQALSESVFVVVVKSTHRRMCALLIVRFPFLVTPVMALRAYLLTRTRPFTLKKIVAAPWVGDVLYQYVKPG